MDYMKVLMDNIREDLKAYQDTIKGILKSFNDSTLRRQDEVSEKLTDLQDSIREIHGVLQNSFEKVIDTKVTTDAKVAGIELGDTELDPNKLERNEAEIQRMLASVPGRKIRIGTSVMEITVPEQIPVELIARNEANIVEFISNNMAYLLPYIDKIYNERK